MPKLFLWLFLFVTFSSCTTYFYVVRHAEKVDESENPPLNEIGKKRARDLRDSLSGKGIDSIFTSSVYIRTRQTVEPLATSLGESVNVFGGTTDQLITALKNIQGRDVLVVGHSNTVPAIVQGLSGQTVPPIDQDDFDNLYIIRIYKCLGIKKSLRQITYGIHSPTTP